MAFQQGLSGLASSSRALDVISSNIANASTVGFKSSSAAFADTFAASMTGAMSNIQVGAGSTVNAVRQNFTQGGLTTTNNALDMAINGNGFFQIQRNNGTIAYSRNGQFDLNKDGYIITPLGEKLMGYQTKLPTGEVLLADSGVPEPLYVPMEGIGAKATKDTGVAPNTIPAAKVKANFDSRASEPEIGTFNKDDPKSYNFMTTMKVYDSQGNPHNVSMYFIKTATPNEWTVNTTFDGVDVGTTTTLTFDTSGKLPDPAPTLSFNADGTNVPLTMSGVDALNFTVTFEGSKQVASPFAVYELQQNGSPPGEIVGLAVTSDGIVQGRYSNGQTQDLGRVALATFRNPNGLISLGNNLWSESTESGQPAVGIPGAGQNGTLSSGQVEESNVDMSQELVQMIIQQRNYQANAQSIRTQDQLLQTLINLR